MEPAKTSAEHLVETIYSTCSHDLPNQVLSLQSLVNLIDMEEASTLGPSGQEYLRRLKTVAEKTADLTDFLKQMVRLTSYEPQSRAIDLAELFAELRIEVGRSLSGPLTWRTPAIIGTAWADYDLVRLGLSAVLRSAGEAMAGSPEATLGITSTTMARSIHVRLSAVGGSSPAVAPGHEGADFLLAKERLRVAGVELTVGPSRGREANVELKFISERP